MIAETNIAAPDSRLRVPDVALAVRVAEAISAYEQFRLTLYRSRPGNPDRIEMRTLGDALAMRFPSVGYFNQVQGFTAADCARMPQFEQFYAGVSGNYKVQLAPDTERDQAADRLAAAGFSVRTETVRMAVARPQPAVVAIPAGMTIAPLASGEVDDFFRTYLECFGADRQRWTAAVLNMRLLHGQPGLHCLFARHQGRPAGVGMVYADKGVAYFCAGGVLEPWREQGLQAALINERLRIAHDAGCDLAVGWTEEGSQSQRNLARAGFQVSYRDPVWVSPLPRAT